jgi:putative ABC transport system permease protein
MLSSLFQDIRYATRMLAKHAGFTLVAMFTLALGIGANAAVFSVVNSVLLRPLPLPASRQLMVLFVKEGTGSQEGGASYPDFEDWRRQSRSFGGLTAFAPQSINLTGGEQPARIRGAFVSSNFFAVMRVQPSEGRAFEPGEDQPGAAHVAIINYGVWQGRLGGDPQILGKSLMLNGEAFTIVGVMPRDFKFPIDSCEVWIPVQYNPHLSRDRAVGSVAIVGRLKETLSRQQAQSEMDTIAQRLAQQFPDTNRNRKINVVPLQDAVTSDIRPAILVLTVAVGFVLLIACANVASLLLVRASGRHREMALRATLGAAPARLVRQMVTETLLLWFAGAILGLALGRWGLEGLARIRPAEIWAQFPARLDPPVLFLTLAVTILSGLAFGLIPALRFSNPNVLDSLKERDRAASPGAGHHRMGRLLAASQVSLALALLLGAGLTMKTLAKLVGVNPGFNPQNLLSLEYRLPRNKYAEKSQQWNFHRLVIEHAAALPGVRSAAEVTGLPISGNGEDTTIVLPDRPAPPPGETPRAQSNVCDVHFFRTMGIPLLQGREFTDEDSADSPPVIIVNHTMARTYWPGSSPIGRAIRLPDKGLTATVVGVVGDVRQYNLDDLEAAQVYLPMAQAPDIFSTLVVRTEGDPMASASALRGAVWAVDRDQPVWKIRTEQSLLDESVGPRRFLMLLLQIFSAVSLLLATLGIYGVVAYSMARRIREIGVRIALGAQRRDILRLVLVEAISIVALGLGVGFVGALGLTRFLSSQLYGISATDPMTFAASASLLAAVALAACYLPARRALRVDPMIALRYE